VTTSKSLRIDLPDRNYLFASRDTLWCREIQKNWELIKAVPIILPEVELFFPITLFKETFLDWILNVKFNAWRNINLFSKRKFLTQNLNLRQQLLWFTSASKMYREKLKTCFDPWILATCFDVKTCIDFWFHFDWSGIWKQKSAMNQITFQTSKTYVMVLQLTGIA